MHIRLFNLLMGACLLASCDGAEHESVHNVRPQEEEAIPADADLAVGAPVIGSEDTADPQASAQSNNSATIPEGFHGVWDYVKGSCAPESDLRLEITASGIVFYEAFGSVMNVEPDGPATIVTLAMEGEGERWTDTFVLMFDDDGETLTPFFRIDEQKSGDTMPRKKCPS